MTHERRMVPRYRLDAEIEVDGHRGRTIDISSHCVRFETSRPYVPGDEVTLVVPLQQMAPAATVECSGRIVRVDGRGPVFGVVATYEPVAFNVSG